MKTPISGFYDAVLPQAKLAERYPAPAVLPAGEVLARLGSSPDGLSPEEAARRRKIGGANVLEPPHDRSRLETLVGQFANVPISLLLASSAVSSLLRDFFDAGAILSVVGINAGLGYQIERKSEELLASWRQLEAGQAAVVRKGALRSIPAADLVVGDVILCRMGDTVPADARVIDAHRLTSDEAVLTGESEPQAKSPTRVTPATPLAECHSMLFAGTTIASGHGRAMVTAIGPATEVARVRQLIAEQKAPQTPLERRLGALGNRIAIAGVGAGVANTLVSLLRGRRLGDVMRSGVALAVAAIPEGLPMVSTAALVQSMQRMRQRGMVVRRLASAETLGSVTVVCADKTGTLTANDMVLEVIDCGRGSVDPATVRAVPRRLFQHGPTLALAAAVLNSDVDAQRHGATLELSGSSTERALVTAALAAGLDRGALRQRFPRRLLRERDGGVHYVTSLHDAPAGGSIAFVKGAPEQVLALCHRDLSGPLHRAGRRRILSRNDALAATGLRVLALAWRSFRQRNPTDLSGGYSFIGLVGLRDPLRPGAADAVKSAAQAGIRTVIVTGDQRRTAESIARAVGLEGETLDGAEAVRLIASRRARDRARFRRAAAFARVAPEQKVAIVQALRKGGDIVAMAGDGVNDAPALKAADVGVAIGIGSSDLARQAADVVLENEDLRSILSAVGEGRIVQDNLRRAVRFLLATNFSEVVLTLGATLVGARDPFTPLQLLWVNLLSDTLPALALALEPGRPDVLDGPPTAPDAPLLGDATSRATIREGILLSGVSAAAFAFGGSPLALATLTGAELGYAFLCRAPGTLPNGRFFRLIGGAAALQLGAMTIPPLRALLGLSRQLSPLEFLAFGGGIVLPVMAGSMRDELIVRRPRNATATAERRTTLHAATTVRTRNRRPIGKLKKRTAAR